MAVVVNWIQTTVEEIHHDFKVQIAISDTSLGVLVLITVRLSDSQIAPTDFGRTGH